MPDLDRLTWTELAGRAPLLVVPVGSTEQHGPHLPLGTDTLVAVALAEQLAAALDAPAATGTATTGTATTGTAAGTTDPVAAAVVGPALPVGSAGEHAGFPGTLSIGQEALELVLVELVRSAGWAAGVVLVNGHGGNVEPVRRAAARLEGEGRAVLAWFPPAVDGGGDDGGDGDAHAGRTETSVVLALAPGLVRSELAAPGATEPLASLLPALRAGGVAAVSTNGVLGDPAGASAQEGVRLLAAWTADLVRAVTAWRARLTP